MAVRKSYMEKTKAKKRQARAEQRVAATAAAVAAAETASGPSSSSAESLVGPSVNSHLQYATAVAAAATSASAASSSSHQAGGTPTFSKSAGSRSSKPPPPRPQFSAYLPKHRPILPKPPSDPSKTLAGLPPSTSSYSQKRAPPAWSPPALAPPTMHMPPGYTPAVAARSAGGKKALPTSAAARATSSSHTAMPILAQAPKQSSTPANGWHSEDASFDTSMSMGDETFAAAIEAGDVTMDIE